MFKVIITYLIFTIISITLNAKAITKQEKIYNEILKESAFINLRSKFIKCLKNKEMSCLQKILPRENRFNNVNEPNLCKGLSKEGMISGQNLAKCLLDDKIIIEGVLNAIEAKKLSNECRKAKPEPSIEAGTISKIFIQFKSGYLPCSKCIGNMIWIDIVKENGVWIIQNVQLVENVC